jgi:outer membrane receptor protein involved in Fe transport
MGWHDARWQLSGGFDLQHARLESPAPGLALPPDNALPIVPRIKAHFVGYRIIDHGPGTLKFGARANWIGATRLSLDPSLNRKIGARATVDLDGAFELGDWGINAGIDNALGSHADTFGFGNSFSIGSMRQKTPMQPRTFRVGIRKTWR